MTGHDTTISISTASFLWYVPLPTSAITRSKLTGLPQIGGRWSTFRQGVIDTARAIISSPESSYALRISDDVDHAWLLVMARNLLSKDSYHFGKTAAVSEQSLN